MREREKTFIRQIQGRCFSHETKREVTFLYVKKREDTFRKRAGTLDDRNRE